MKSSDSSLPKPVWREDFFSLIKPEEFSDLGIDPEDIPPGTFPAKRRPFQLSSRFGGNAYGFGFFEISDRLKEKDLSFIQSIALEDPESIKKNNKKLNQIYKKIGLLIRFSNLGKPYYLIPIHLLSSTLTHIKSKVDEISKIIEYHRKKYLKEYYDIGLVTHQDDLIALELSLRFKEHRFTMLGSIEKLRGLDKALDLIIFPRDLYKVVLMENFSPLSKEKLTKKRLDQYATYVLWKICNCLKADGEIFVIANRNSPRTSRTTKVVFKTDEEKKNFTLFNHIFKTRKKYLINDPDLEINVFDFQKYLSDLYVEDEVINKLLGDQQLDTMNLKDVETLPYLNLPLGDFSYFNDQEESWSKLLSVFFNKIFLKPLIPPEVTEGWGKRFSCPDYSPNYMLIYLGQKKPVTNTLDELKQDAEVSKLSGCPLALVAEYRDSFEYVIQTLRVLDGLKKGSYDGLPQIFLERLKQPLETKKRRYSGLNNVTRLITKISRLVKVKNYLNPDNIEGERTKALGRLEALSFFGFNHGEIKEIFLIILGHTSMGRIISGKMNERTLKPVTDLARQLDHQQALNLLRYCRLMTLAEIEAAGGSQLTQEQLAELFDLYESTVRVTTIRDLDWEKLLDENISSLGGIHNKVIRKILKMINSFEFLDNWDELRQKGSMEKEYLADYDEHKLSRIENVINLVLTIEFFENLYLKSDPLQLPAFYRKFLEIEFHGTGHLFQRMDSRLVFVLLWISVNAARGEVVNFNQILAEREAGEINDQVKAVEQEAQSINTHYLDLPTLKAFSDKLYKNGSAFIVGTGFQLTINHKAQALEIKYVDVDQNTKELESLSEEIAGRKLSEIPGERLKYLNTLFSQLESFYQSHTSLLEETDSNLKLPEIQKRWFHKAQKIGRALRSNFIKLIFHPENIYTDLALLYSNVPSLLDFILPEFMALRDVELKGHLYLKNPVNDYIIKATKKFQALVQHDRGSFQSNKFLHELAQREFGPMATGIVGVNEAQIGELERIVDDLQSNKSLFDALVKSFIFQDIGRIPALREKYNDEINRADLSQTGALFLEREEIPKKFDLDKETSSYLIFLIRHHSLLHHIVRGEVDFSAIKEILESQDQKVFDALFVFSFVMLSALGENLVLEDLASRLFQIRTMCHLVLEDKTTFEEQIDELLIFRGELFYALENYMEKGLPEGLTPAEYLTSKKWIRRQKSDIIRAGRMIFALERIFRLRGIRYIEFIDLANLILKVPLKYIYSKRKLSSIGYATFEKEMYESLRIYNTLQYLAEPTRHFILTSLNDDKIRIFGYEKVSDFLSYENQIKILLIGLMGTRRIGANGGFVCVSFLEMAKIIEKRYEAVNDFLNGLPMEKIWTNKYQLNQFFKAKTGITLKKDENQDVLYLSFRDRINIHQKTAYMQTIKNLDQLRNYFHYSLRSLRASSFSTDDYELRLEKAYEKRLKEITNRILDQANKQMELISDFEDLHNLVSDFQKRSYDIGFSEDQRNRLNDLYELRKDKLRREKLSEIEAILGTMHEEQELKDYWESVKWYLLSNRQFLGKEFENLIAKKFDSTGRGMRA